MLKKYKEAKTEKKNSDVVELIALTEKYFEQIEKKLAAAEDMTDAAEKILKLRDLKDEIQQTDRQADRKQEGLVKKRVGKKLNITGGTGATIGTAAVVVPLAIIFPPVVFPLVVLGIAGAVTGLSFSQIFTAGHFNKSTREKLIEQNPLLTYFGNILAAQKARAQEVFNDTIKNCNLDEVSLSPHYKEAFDSTASLRDRFALAHTDTAKQALEAKAQQEAAQAIEKKKESGPSGRLKI
jgi:hypothetical protein